MTVPPVQYLSTAQGHLAWQSWGEGPLTILDAGIGTLFSLEEIEDQPRWLRWVERLASFARVLRLDYPGLGLSDVLPGEPPDPFSSEALLHVLDAAEVEQAAVVGACAHALTAISFAATHPDRVSALVLISPTSRLREAEDYPQGLPDALVTAMMSTIAPGADASDSGDLALQAPSLASDPDFARWWSRAARRGASPAVAAAVNGALFEQDVRALLPQVRAKTLVVARRDLPLELLLQQSRFVAAAIPNSTLVELPGQDMLPLAGDTDGLLDEVQLFLTGSRYGAAVHRHFAVVLLTDIVGSTSLAVRLGDARWREVLLDHEAMMRREVARHGGQVLKDTGDGALCTFTHPSQAVRCALALREAAHRLGLQIRAGLHAGEVEQRGDELAGINVHTAARVAAMAGPDEVLVSGTVVDLVEGSSLRFLDRGRHELKGVPGLRQLWVVDQP